MASVNDKGSSLKAETTDLFMHKQANSEGLGEKLGEISIAI